VETSDTPNFDFDQMAQLAKSDPVEFARCREELIRQLVSTLGQSADLINYQMDLDSTRYCSAPGIQLSQTMQDLMLRQIDIMNGYLDIYVGSVKAGAD
jgi:hypothetical protein